MFSFKIEMFSKLSTHTEDFSLVTLVDGIFFFFKFFGYFPHSTYQVSKLLNFLVTTLPRSIPRRSTIRWARSGCEVPENTLMFGILEWIKFRQPACFSKLSRIKLLARIGLAERTGITQSTSRSFYYKFFLRAATSPPYRCDGRRREKERICMGHFSLTALLRSFSRIRDSFIATPASAERKLCAGLSVCVWVPHFRSLFPKATP